MAIAIEKTDHILNYPAAAEMYLDLADVAAGRMLWVWASYIVWNITGSITRIFYQDGATEIDLTAHADTGINSNPRIFAWYLKNVPSKVGENARVVVQFTPTGDRRIIVGGYSLSGADLDATVPTINAANDQATNKKYANLIVNPATKAGLVLDFVTCLRGGSQTKPDYIPQTAGLVEKFDSIPFPGGSQFYGAAAGAKDAPEITTYPLQWEVSPSYDTAWNYAGVMLEAAPTPAPVRTQSLTLEMQKVRTLTVKEVAS